MESPSSPLPPLPDDPSRGLIRTALLLGSAALLLVWLMAGVVMWETWRTTQRGALLDLAQHRRLLAEQTSAFVTAIDATLRLLAERVATGRFTPHVAEAQLALRELRVQLPQVDRLDVVDHDGRLLGSSNPDRRDLSYAGDPTFEGQINDPSCGLLIGPAYRDRAGHWAFRMSRALMQPDGSFAGIVVATIDAATLEEMYAALDLDVGERVALLDLGRQVIARYPNWSVTEIPQLRELTSEGPQRIVVPSGARWVGMQTVHDTPVTIAVVRDEDAMLADWHTLSRFVIAVGLLSALPVFLLTLLLLRRAQAQRRWAAALETARMRAERASDAKSEFLAHMSHELRTPLNAVLGFADVIRHRMLPQRAPEYGESIHQAGTHLLALVNDLLDLHRIEDGSFHLDLQPLDAATALQDALVLVAPLAERRRVVLSAPPSPVAELVLADARALRQCLFNLLGNAIKFTPEGGSVEARIERIADGRVRFSICDQGLGIPSNELEHIFEPFRRSNASVAADQQGAGLGLAITKRLADLHAGTLALASVEGRGTTATLDLPRAA